MPALAARPGGGRDPAALRFADMTAVAQAFRRLRNTDGTLMGTKMRQDLQGAFYTDDCCATGDQART